MTEAFMPAPLPVVMFDRVLQIPVLLLGHWVNEEGATVRVEVSTMTQPRQPYQVASFPDMREDPLRPDDPLPRRLRRAATHLAARVNAGQFRAAGDAVAFDLRNLSLQLLEFADAAEDLLDAAARPGRTA